ncbi:MAG: hypothetical protein BWY31_01754 [Lentisphaerae bacterium ADurb.Bin242]|nr:MAG: hypothetical protein BWY31_01754 [Lentisphaerae bacterium ADurb.Bin242]
MTMNRKHFLTAVFFPGILLCCISLCAQEILFSPEKVTDWLWNYTPDKVSVSEENGTKVFRVYGYRQLFSVQKFPVETGKAYRLSGEFRAGPGTIPAKFYFGFSQFAEKGRLINSPQVNILPGTDAVLLSDVAKSDTVVFLDSGANWKKGGFVVFGARKDLSDLPNFRIAKGTVSSVEIKDGVVKLTLSRPAGLEAGKGTGVREHFPGGNYHYAGALNETAPREWTGFEGIISGFASSGLPREKWWPGAESVSVLILANYRGPKESVLEFRNLKFEMIKKENH